MFANIREGERIVLEGEADQVPDQEPGDIVFHLDVQEHKTFKRAGTDLLAELTVTLAEALCGFSRVVLTHLDGRGIELTYPRKEGDVLKPGQVLKIPGEGMPHKRSNNKGDLYLVVNVEFPDSNFMANQSLRNQLQDMLPKAAPAITAETVDSVDYDADADIDEFGADEQGGSAWEDDEEGPAGAQCAQQ